MSFLLGLTGSIGMGKSTTAQMFVAHGAALWDADATVHRLYGPGGAASAEIARHWPDAVSQAGVSRPALKAHLDQDPAMLKQLEQIVHPLVAEDRAAFIADAASDILLFDIPLLFETGADSWLDKVCVVSVPYEVQRARVMARQSMSEAQFETICARQMPDADKRARADWIIETLTLEGAEAQVAEIVKQIRGEADA